MAGPFLAADYQATTGGFGVTSFAGGKLAQLDTGDIVYLRASYSTSGQAVFTQVAYRVLGWEIITNGSKLFQGKTGTVDTTQAANVAIDGTSSVTHALYPYWYRIQNYTNPSDVQIVHESDLLNITGVNVVRDANNWVNPS